MGKRSGATLADWSWLDLGRRQHLVVLGGDGTPSLFDASLAVTLCGSAPRYVPGRIEGSPPLCWRCVVAVGKVDDTAELGLLIVSPMVQVTAEREPLLLELLGRHRGSLPVWLVGFTPGTGGEHRWTRISGLSVASSDGLESSLAELLDRGGV